MGDSKGYAVPVKHPQNEGARHHGQEDQGALLRLRNEECQGRENRQIEDQIPRKPRKDNRGGRIYPQ